MKQDFSDDDDSDISGVNLVHDVKVQDTDNEVVRDLKGDIIENNKDLSQDDYDTEQVLV